MISVEDVEDLNAKLASDRAKAREGGVKALGSYLEGAAGWSICPSLDQQTALLRANERITSATWPRVLNALCDCIVVEVGANKKRGPKPILPKTLRNFVHEAEDTSRSGKTHFLLRKIKKLFQNILDVLQEVSAFSSDYSHIRREQLPDVEYRLRMSKKIYNDLVSLYLAKAKEIVYSRKPEASVAKDEAFRNTLTLLILLQNPPGDLAPHVKEDIVDGFCEIFAFNRRIEFGDEVAKFHPSFRPFMVRTWLTTRDRDLKLQYIVALDDGSVLEELVGPVEKELDRTGIALTGYHRYDIMREDKVCSVSRSEKCFLEFAAAISFEVGRVHGKANKRRRKESVYALVLEKIIAAKILWDGTFSAF